jgi:hypothetical protein
LYAYFRARAPRRQLTDLLPIVSLHAAGNVGGNVAFGAGALVARLPVDLS